MNPLHKNVSNSRLPTHRKLLSVFIEDFVSGIND